MFEGAELLSNLFTDGRDFSDGKMMRSLKSDKEFYNNIDKGFYIKDNIKVTRIKF